MERRRIADRRVGLWTRRCPRRVVRTRDVHPCDPFHTSLREIVWLAFPLAFLAAKCRYCYQRSSSQPPVHSRNTFLYFEHHDLSSFLTTLRVTVVNTFYRCCSTEHVWTYTFYINNHRIKIYRKWSGPLRFMSVSDGSRYYFDMSNLSYTNLWKAVTNLPIM